MTTQELDALEKLCDGATALMGDGWEYDADSLMVYFSAGYINTRQPIAGMRGGEFLMQYSGDTFDKILPQLHANGRFIASARTAVPALIAEVRRLQEATKPRVIPWHQIPAMTGLPVYLELRNSEHQNHWRIVRSNRQAPDGRDIEAVFSDAHHAYAEYNLTWRVWTDGPTTDQSAAVSWRGPQSKADEPST